MGRFDRSQLVPVVVLVVLMCSPLVGRSEIVSFTFDAIEWQQVGLGSERALLEIDLGTTVQEIVDVRAAYECSSFAGIGHCTVGWESYTRPCPAVLWGSFSGISSGDDPLSTRWEEFVGEDSARAGEFEFVSRRFVGTSPVVEPIAEDAWSILLDGTATFTVFRDSWMPCNGRGVPCTAYLELHSVTVAVEYSTIVPVDQGSWGGVKASYR